MADVWEKMLANREAQVEQLRALVAVQTEYIDLLDKALGTTAPYLLLHGWKTPQEDIDKGEELRHRIVQLTEAAGLSQVAIPELGQQP